MSQRFADNSPLTTVFAEVLNSLKEASCADYYIFGLPRNYTIPAPRSLINLCINYLQPMVKVQKWNETTPEIMDEELLLNKREEAKRQLLSEDSES